MTRSRRAEWGGRLTLHRADGREELECLLLQDEFSLLELDERRRRVALALALAEVRLPVDSL